MLTRLFAKKARPAAPAPWRPLSPLARIELARARSICWDYDKFRYHLDRAIQLEAEHQADLARAARGGGVAAR